MTVKYIEEEGGKSLCTWVKLCRFVPTLLHSNLITVQLPTSDSSSSPLNETAPPLKKFCGGLRAENTSKTIIQTVMDALQIKCSAHLKQLHIKTLKRPKPCLPKLNEDSHMGENLFRALPRLTSLTDIQIDHYPCGDWALKQFAEHGTNLV